MYLLNFAFNGINSAILIKYYFLSTDLICLSERRDITKELNKSWGDGQFWQRDRCIILPWSRNVFSTEPTVTKKISPGGGGGVREKWRGEDVLESACYGGFFETKSSLFDLIFFQFFQIEDCDPLPMGHWVITEAPGLQRFYWFTCLTFESWLLELTLWVCKDKLHWQLGLVRLLFCAWRAWKSDEK